MLNGDGVGTFKVATSAPGTSTHYDNWLLAQNFFYVDRISSGSYYYDHNDTTINNNYGLYLLVLSISLITKHIIFFIKTTYK